MDYTITRTLRTNFIDEAGMATDGYRVHFVMEDGTADYVEVPKAKYNRKFVEEAIEVVIAAHAEVGS